LRCFWRFTTPTSCTASSPSLRRTSSSAARTAAPGHELASALPSP
jgi:hypothetical protein